MKIAVIGYSGAGKSTLARVLGERFGIPVLHFDTVQFTPNWQERNQRPTSWFTSLWNSHRG